MLTKNAVLSEWLNGPRQQRWAALADVLQSATGLILGVFLLIHIHFEAAILLGKETFYRLVQVLEGGWFTASGHGSAWVTQIFSLFMLLIVMLHGAMALRRFPAQRRQWQALRAQQLLLNHTDSRLWLWQMGSGFLLFFLVPMHLVTMITQPEIGPHLSAGRVWHDNYWLVYLLLLPAVVVHGMLGLYRLALKWGLSLGRKNLRRSAYFLIGYLLLLGLCSLLTYLLIGRELPLPITPYTP